MSFTTLTLYSCEDCQTLSHIPSWFRSFSSEVVVKAYEERFCEWNNEASMYSSSETFLSQLSDVTMFPQSRSTTPSSMFMSSASFSSIPIPNPRLSLPM